MNTGLYLDANATEPLRPAARAAALAAMEVGGNPSSVHAAGRAARRILEDAREVVAARFGAQPQQVVMAKGTWVGTPSPSPSWAGSDGGPESGGSGKIRVDANASVTGFYSPSAVPAPQTDSAPSAEAAVGAGANAAVATAPAAPPVPAPPSRSSLTVSSTSGVVTLALQEAVDRWGAAAEAQPAVAAPAAVAPPSLPSPA